MDFEVPGVSDTLDALGESVKPDWLALFQALTNAVASTEPSPVTSS